MDRRWIVFRVILGVLFLGIALDFLTTVYFQARTGNFEQNPLALWITGWVGWPGLGIILLLFCFGIYKTCEYISKYMDNKVIYTVMALYSLVAIERILVIFGNIYGYLGG